MGNTLLEMKGITKRFPGVVALNNVSMKINSGEVLAVVGENLLHLPACISSTQGVFVGIMHDGNLFVFYLQTAKSRMLQIYSFALCLRARAAEIKQQNSGCARLGRDLNSG